MLPFCDIVIGEVFSENVIMQETLTGHFTNSIALSSSAYNNQHAYYQYSCQHEDYCADKETARRIHLGSGCTCQIIIGYWQQRPDCAAGCHLADSLHMGWHSSLSV